MSAGYLCWNDGTLLHTIIHAVIYLNLSAHSKVDHVHAVWQPRRAPSALGNTHNTSSSSRGRNVKLSIYTQNVPATLWTMCAVCSVQCLWRIMCVCIHQHCVYKSALITVIKHEPFNDVMYMQCACIIAGKSSGAHAQISSANAISTHTHCMEVINQVPMARFVLASRTLIPDVGKNVVAATPRR